MKLTGLLLNIWDGRNETFPFLSLIRECYESGVSQLVSDLLLLTLTEILLLSLFMKRWKTFKSKLYAENLEDETDALIPMENGSRILKDTNCLKNTHLIN